MVRIQLQAQSYKSKIESWMVGNLRAMASRMSFALAVGSDTSTRCRHGALAKDWSIHTLSDLSATQQQRRRDVPMHPYGYIYLILLSLTSELFPYHLKAKVAFGSCAYSEVGEKHRDFEVWRVEYTASTSESRLLYYKKLTGTCCDLEWVLVSPTWVLTCEPEVRRQKKHSQICETQM